MQIVLLGPSSSGKTSVLSLFPDDIKKVNVDDYFQQETKEDEKDLENKYYSNKQKEELFNTFIDNWILTNIKGHANFIVDTVNDKPQHLKRILPNGTVFCLLF